jgi:shikimate kinase/3-dehydroquinate synthase
MPLNSESLPGTERSIVLVGLMGAGKTAIGKRLAAQLGLPFFDADQEIERAAGTTIAEIFRIYGEAYFRAGEKRVIQRLLANGPIVLAPGGGAFMDPETRAVIRDRAISVWLRCPLSILLQRVQGRTHRPLINTGNPEEVLQKLSDERSPFYAQADIIIDGSEDPLHMTTNNVINALAQYSFPRRVTVALSQNQYDVLIGPHLLEHAGAAIAPLLRHPRCVIITDSNVAGLHLQILQSSLTEVGVTHTVLIVPSGELSKNLQTWQSLVESLLAQNIDRHTAIVALGGGVVGDLAGFVAASTLRGLPFIQIPTTLLSQVDSSVGGKTGVNCVYGKNLIGAFHQPLLVIADTNLLKTLPSRELRAGYAEIIKAGLISDAELYEWCETHADPLTAGDETLLGEAIERAVRFKAAIVGDDERETKTNNGRALLNLGHTFAHALEAETGYGAELLHGEAVAIGLVLATHLSAQLGFCPQEDTVRVADHNIRAGLPARIAGLKAGHLLAHMKQDKKMSGGKLTFVLTRGIGQAFTSNDVTENAVRATLLANGAV